ncbi:hypothetical protein Pcinc_037509 [Petrolisthes cinctipes]|uniref:Uncharacterized protein n=1 Tax=Petrolisthes cinctipes TaxID=88211 RepID=A0AAE1ELG8_PETCI|nr:hypothetical protein Pcinc_037509 [Petrolisthes cinctipes]
MGSNGHELPPTLLPHLLCPVLPLLTAPFSSDGCQCGEMQLQCVCEGEGGRCVAGGQEHMVGRAGQQRAPPLPNKGEGGNQPGHHCIGVE